MELFSLEKYLENPSCKVVTREGRPVRIVCWDSPNKGFPIVGFIDDNPTIFVWDKYGYALSGHRESNRDLFFADEKEELTEFEKAVEKTIPYKIPIDMLKSTSQQLFDLARKEILKDLPKWKTYEGELIGNGLIFEDNVNLVLVRNGYYIDFNELEKLPKGK